MRVFTEQYPNIGGPFAVCIGKFDGLHIGHRRILDALLGGGAQAFAPRPSSIPSSRGTASPAADDGRGKGRAFRVAWHRHPDSGGAVGRVHGAAGGAVSLKSLPPAGNSRPWPWAADFRFGRGAAGDVALLKKLGEKHGFAVHAIDSGGDGQASRFPALGYANA